VSDVLTDAELVRAAQAGSTASLGLLLERHRASMRAVALSLLGYSPEAQDAVQDAMLVALQRIGDLREPSAAGPWLRAIVRNACRMRRRASRTVHVDDFSGVALPSDELSPDAQLDRHALRDWVWHALEELSEPLQLVILLRYFSGVTSYVQIAALCGVPVGTVRSRLHQARLKLSDALLATASAAHNEAAALSSHRWREAAELFSAAERGEFSKALAAWCSPDVDIVGPQGQRGRGAQLLTRIMESDLAAGVTQRPVHVVASRKITIMECDLLSPPWDPDHCPPGVAWLLFQRDEHVERARLFHPIPAAHSLA
jgi:RNA polymerase sigma-70 factor (ECF subfamily)